MGRSPTEKKARLKAKKAKIEALTSMSLELMTQATFAPYATNVTILDSKLWIEVELDNGSFVIGAFNLNKKKDYTQIDQAKLLQSKIMAQSSDNTMVVVGDNNEICLPEKSYSIVKHVIFQTSYSTIKEDALSFMEEMETVELPDNITTISYNSFGWCYSLREINLPFGLEYLGTAAFHLCPSLTSIEIPESCQFSDSENIFNGCGSLCRVKLPQTTRSIPKGMFFGCSSLSEINIPDSVTMISHSSFAGCPILTFESEHFSLKEGLLVHKDEKKLLKYTRFDLRHPSDGAKEVVIPEGINVIGGFAFGDNVSLERVTIPSSVQKIEANAFVNCSALTHILLSNPDIDIDRKAFKGCTAITEVDLPQDLTWKEIKNRFKESPWGKTPPAISKKKSSRTSKTSKNDKTSKI